MSSQARIALTALLTSCLAAPVWAQAASKDVAPRNTNVKIGLDILTDTRGAQLGPYLQTLVAGLEQHWTLPASAAQTPSPSMQQEVTLLLTIAPDGRISALKLDSARANEALNKAAWADAIDTTYAPPPAAMNGSGLQLRIHFIPQ